MPQHMARASKAPFTTDADTGIPTSESAYQSSFGNAINAQQSSLQTEYDEQQQDDGFVTESDDVSPPSVHERHESEHELGEQSEDGENENAPYDRRISAFSHTSISSIPNSTYPSDHEPYKPPLIRPSFRRPISIQRMQMMSPPPFSRGSTRQSVLRSSKSRSGTPRSERADAHGSSRPRHPYDETEEAKKFPLVLLHITLLPIQLPWSMELVQGLLPSHTSDNLQLLRSKVSDTVLRRGILIPHPREEYELLEERLLEALELKSERVTKCGHFRGRESTRCTAMSTDLDQESDSGLGSSISEAEENVCATCHCSLKIVPSAAGRGRQKWTIRVFAANGLMRASAWAAGWSEMESVDVEILPCISDELRSKLDDRREAEEEDERAESEDEIERLREIGEEQVRLAHEERASTAQRKRVSKQKKAVARQRPEPAEPGTGIRLPQPVPAAHKEGGPREASSPDLPQIYRSSQIPLSMLLRNYIYLLAQDRRNVAMFFLGLIALFFAIKPAPAPQALVVPSLADACDGYQFVAATEVMSVAHLAGGSEHQPPLPPVFSDKAREGETFPGLEVSETSPVVGLHLNAAQPTQAHLAISLPEDSVAVLAGD